jgi:Phage integrase, N-terminal SAM-like domain
MGPAWTARGRPPAGYFTKRNAEEWLRALLEEARAGTLPGMVRTGVTFADACDEYLRYVEVDLDRKPSTVCDYRSIIRAHLLPAFGSLRLEDVTAERIEAWKASAQIGNRSKAKVLTVLNGVLKRARPDLQAPLQPDGGRREAPLPRFDLDRGLLCRGDLGPRPRGRVRAGRRDLPHGRLHRSPPRRTDRPPLARRRLHRRSRPRLRLIRRRRP